jgi:hypothetical protein
MALPIALMAFAMLFFSPTDGRSAEEESLAVAAARTRQELVKTLDVKFKRTEVIPKGSFSDRDPKAFGKRAPVPANELTMESNSRIVIEGEMIYYEDGLPTWNNLYAPNGGLIKQSIVTVGDGATVKLLFPRGLGETGNPQGTIRKEARAGHVISSNLMPITMSFRGSNTAINPRSIMEMKLTGNTLPIDWTPCQEHTIKLNDRNMIARFWVDPEKDYVIRRYEGVPGMGRTDIRYRRDDAWGWVPEAWIYNEYSQTGVLQRTSKVEVFEMRINEPHPAEFFDIRFPPGCVVRDTRTGPDKVYYVLSDGSMREISERTGEFLHEPKVQPAGAWYWRYRWLLGGLGVILAGLAWQYAARRKRANAA